MLLDPSAAGSDDLALLTAATNALRLLSNPDKPCSYCSRLHKNFTWCTEIATLIHNCRKSVLPITTKSGSGLFDQSTFDSSKFTQDDASEQFPIPARKSTHGFEGDLQADDGSQHAKSSYSSDSWNATPLELNANDFSFFQSSDLFHNNEIALKADSLTDMFAQSADMTPVTSAQFQDTLKWMYDKGTGLQSSI